MDLFLYIVSQESGPTFFFANVPRYFSRTLRGQNFNFFIFFFKIFLELIYEFLRRLGEKFSFLGKMSTFIAKRQHLKRFEVSFCSHAQNWE
jgi:hypothetical protein